MTYGEGMNLWGNRHRQALTTLTGAALIAASLIGCAPTATDERLATASNPTSASASASASPETSLQPKGPVVSGRVVRVVDGDTARVLIDGAREDVSVRFIGIDTPETVAPGRPIECFGPEASDFATQLLDGAQVLLEFDPTQGETDRYGRTLAYVWVVTPTGGLELFNLAAIAGGYAEEVTYAADYAWQEEFQRADAAARAAGIGRWSAC